MLLAILYIYIYIYIYISSIINIPIINNYLKVFTEYILSLSRNKLLCQAIIHNTLFCIHIFTHSLQVIYIFIYRILFTNNIYIYFKLFPRAIMILLHRYFATV